MSNLYIVYIIYAIIILMIIIICCYILQLFIKKINCNIYCIYGRDIQVRTPRSSILQGMCLLTFRLKMTVPTVGVCLWNRLDACAPVLHACTLARGTYYVQGPLVQVTLARGRRRVCTVAASCLAGSSTC